MCAFSYTFNEMSLLCVRWNWFRLSQPVGAIEFVLSQIGALWDYWALAAAEAPLTALVMVGGGLVDVMRPGAVLGG
jgi:hypothetical protein